MTTAAVAFVSAMALGTILTRAARSAGVRAGALDHALVSRKIHHRPIPRVGGVAIVLSFYATLVVVLLLDGDAGQQLQAHARRAQGLLVGGVLIAALGLYDDFKGANASTKLLVQTGAAALMYGCGFRIDHVALPLAPTMELGLLGAPLTVLWIVGITNAMNLVDGLDGLAAGVALVAALTTLTIATIGGDTVLALSAAALAGAIVGFLFYNFHPASIFMGDTGSMFLGFVLATTAIQASGRDSGAVAILVPAVALGLPIADTVLAIARRAARGAPIFLGDAGHIHHRLLQRGLSQREAALILYGACVVLGGSALFVSFAPGGQALGALLALSGAAWFLLRRLGVVGLGVTDELREQRRRNLMLRRLVRRAGEAARRAQTPEQLWEQVRQVAPVMGASSVGFRIGPAGGRGVSYSHGFADAPPEALRVRYALTPERPGESCVELGWNDGRTRVDRDSEIVIELLCREIARVVKRIESVPSAPDASRGVRIGA